MPDYEKSNYPTILYPTIKCLHQNEKTKGILKKIEKIKLIKLKIKFGNTNNLREITILHIF